MATQYGAIKTLVGDYLHRPELVSTVIPNFIEYGRIRLFTALRVPEMEFASTITITSNVGTLPIDTVGIRNVYNGTDTLRRVNLEDLPYYTSGGVYAIRGASIYAPAQTSITASLYIRPPTFIGTADTTTSPVWDAWPTLWLQATLVEAYIYLEDPENEARARERLDVEVDSANASTSILRQGIAPQVQSDYQQVATESVR